MATMNDLGRLSAIAGEAIGPPGRRQFRLCMMNAADEFASCWMEKEQLAALGEAIEQGLRDQSFEPVQRPLDDVEAPVAFPLNTTLDFRVGRLSIGIDPADHLVQVTVGDRYEPSMPESSEVRGTFTFDQGHELAVQIRTVVAAGRPPCPLCSAPMDPAGHVCVKTNGHHPH